MFEDRKEENSSLQIEIMRDLDCTHSKYENWSLQSKNRDLEFTDIQLRLEFTDIQLRLEFTDRKYENWSLQIESRRIGVYR